MDETNPINPQPQPSEHNSKDALWYIVGGIVIVVLGGGFFLWRNMAPQTHMPSSSLSEPVTTQKKPPLPRSKAPEVVTSLVAAAALDAKGGSALPVSSFSAKDKTIYVVASVSKPQVGTKIEYIRYLNGKYLDSGTQKIAKPNLTHVSFFWSLKKAGATHPLGNYIVNVYTNGIFEKATTYVVR